MKIKITLKLYKALKNILPYSQKEIRTLKKEDFTKGWKYLIVAESAIKSYEDSKKTIVIEKRRE